jgi:hypothetical protein
MSTLVQVEQGTPSTPSAAQQITYPKVGGAYRMASDGIEKQLLDSGTYAAGVSAVIMQAFYQGI